MLKARNYSPADYSVHVHSAAYHIYYVNHNSCDPRREVFCTCPWTYTDRSHTLSIIGHSTIICKRSQCTGICEKLKRLFTPLLLAFIKPRDQRLRHYATRPQSFTVLSVELTIFLKETIELTFSLVFHKFVLRPKRM